MQKHLLQLAILGAFSVAGAASAADISVYSIVDTGIAYTSKDIRFGSSEAVLTHGNEKSFSMQSGYNEASRFGLKGSETLGNGLTAGFKLENGFSSDDGAMRYDDRLFGREAALFLSGDFGTVAFGRMGGVASSAGTYDLVYAIADAFDGGDNDVFGLQASDRYDNTATYQTPKFSGLQATLQYAFKTDGVKGEGTEGTSKADRYASAALTGDFGPLQWVGAYELTKYANTDRHEDTHIFYAGGNYDFGVARVFALAQYAKASKSFATFENAFADEVASGVPGAEKGIDGFGAHLGTIVPLFGGDLTAAAYYAEGESETLGYDFYAVQGDFSYLGFSARYVYPLSKRTSLYAGAGLAREKSTANTDYGAYSDTNRYTQAYAGLTHRF
ncbi:porin [Sutterella megalosphaeroides]|uniref:Porin n=1 Tax=Sutterella megalosphaeroides TaxID=2494234 RepID=A0A2Z6IAN9_9BURK|nr:porin [Sutterella megalosphaeroides]BBF23402.1 porin [Sutterella megalosphaeroides]